MDFAANMTSATETVAEQLVKGTYQTVRSNFFNRPQLYMDYWHNRVPAGAAHFIAPQETCKKTCQSCGKKEKAIPHHTPITAAGKMPQF